MKFETQSNSSWYNFINGINAFKNELIIFYGFFFFKLEFLFEFFIKRLKKKN